MFANNRSSMRAQRGFTLIELMVSLVISLLIGLAAFGSAQFFMAMQKQGQGAGAAQAAATLSADALKYELQQAGLGFYADGAVRCQTMNLSSGNTDYSSAGSFFPINISTATGSTVIDAVYASAMESAAPAFLKLDATNKSTQLELNTYLPATAGQTILLAPNAGGTSPCLIRNVSSVAAADATHGEQLTLNTSDSYSQVTFPTASYPATSTVSLFGQLNWTRFSLNAGNLVMTQVLTGKSVILARNVVGFAAQYGVLNATQTALDSWQYPENTWATLSPTLLAQVRAIRVGIVVRSPQQEKADPTTGLCTATTTQPQLLDRTLNLTGTWQCYRYRSATVNVPLRNAILGTSA